jgi:hypothetical protein
MLNPALPQFPAGTQWALRRRMSVIDSEGRIRPTSIVESIQVRRYVELPSATDFSSNTARAQEVFEFVASRGQNGDLREIPEGERDFAQFSSHGGDPFELHAGRRSSRESSDFRNLDVLTSCQGCHGRSPGIHSVQSYARVFGYPQALRPPELVESDEDRESPEAIHWKHQQYDFGLLQGLWRRAD